MPVVSKALAFNNTLSWDEWDTRTVVTKLVAGTNTIRARMRSNGEMTRSGTITYSMVTTNLRFAGNQRTPVAAPGQPLNYVSVETSDAFRGQRIVGGNDALDGGGGRDQGMIITLVMQMNQDGTPVKAEIRDTGRYNNDPTYRAAADAAHRALMNPRCHPWPLLPEKFNSWRTITFNFDPRDY
jgi:hypothetical protein